MKIAISVPDPVFEAAEALARDLKVSRSELYSRALAAYLGTRGALAVTEKLNAVYAADPQQFDRALARAQSATLDDETW